MARPAALALALALALAPTFAARAEIYRCESEDGSVTFTSDSHACERPVAYTPDADRVVISPADAAAESAPPAERDPEPDATRVPAPPRDASQLEALLPATPVGWEALREAPETTADPELRASGLHGSIARHYTRILGPISMVCTVEIWAFERAGQARAARDALDRPLWWSRTTGALLVVAHGIRLERQVGARAGLVPGCEALADATLARAARP